MANLKTLSEFIYRNFTVVLLAFMFCAANDVSAQNLQTVYDGRTEYETSTPSNADVQLIKRNALPNARQIWRNNESCQESFEVVDVASGSFTKPKAAQKAVLYRFCTTGHDFANNGIAIIEGGKIVANVFYNAGEDSSIRGLADINGNGLSEIILADGASHQGYTNVIITLIEITQAGVKSFGIADVSEDDCGAKDPCKEITRKITVKPGKTPIFYRQTYRQRNKEWMTVGKLERFSFRASEGSPKTEYRLLD